MANVERTTKNGMTIIQTVAANGNKMELRIDKDSVLHLYINGRFKNTILNNSDYSQLDSNLRAYVDARTPVLTEVSCALTLSDIYATRAILKDLANEYNKYIIKLPVGILHVTDPLELEEDDNQPGSYSILSGSDFIKFEGAGKEKTIVYLEFSSGTTFHDGKTYLDYQTVSMNCNDAITNLSSYCKNAKYPIHFEGANLVTNETQTCENLYLRHYGNDDMGSTSCDCIGIGMRDGQTINFKNVDAISKYGVVGVHSALNQTVRGGWLNFDQCSFDGVYMHFDTYPNELPIEVNFNNCKRKRKMYMSYKSYYTTTSISANYSHIKINSTSSPILFYRDGFSKGKGLKITTLTTGTSQTISFDQTCTAFNYIVGNNADTILRKTQWQSDFQYGYEWRNGGVGMAGYVCGHNDIDSGTTHTSLGKKLGNCSVVNKTLTVVIAGTTYDVVFNTDLTAATNAAVLALINDVIGAVATASEYVVGQDYYPNFDGIQVRSNSVTDESTAILKGMGVVFVGDSACRRAANADNRIDGVALDTFALGQYGRIAPVKSEFFSLYFKNSDPIGYGFFLLDDAGTSIAADTQLGISAANRGYFSASATPKVARAWASNKLEIL